MHFNGETFASGILDIKKFTCLHLVVPYGNLVGLISPAVVHRHDSIWFSLSIAVGLCCQPLLCNLILILVWISLNDLLSFLFEYLTGYVIDCCNLARDNSFFLHKCGRAHHCSSCLHTGKALCSRSLTFSLSLICRYVLWLLFWNHLVSHWPWTSRWASFFTTQGAWCIWLKGGSFGDLPFTPWVSLVWFKLEPYKM